MTDAPAGGRWQMRFAFADTPTEPVTDREDNNPPATAASSSRTPVHEPPAVPPGTHLETPTRNARFHNPRTPSRLPVPTPLPDAVEAGHFGHEENGAPVRPSRDEVREITASHAESLKDALLDRQVHAFEQGLVKYAESFGPEAAEGLRSYVQHLARESVRPTWRR